MKLMRAFGRCVRSLRRSKPRGILVVSFSITFCDGEQVKFATEHLETRLKTTLEHAARGLIES